MYLLSWLQLAFNFSPVFSRSCPLSPTGLLLVAVHRTGRMPRNRTEHLTLLQKTPPLSYCPISDDTTMFTETFN